MGFAISGFSENRKLFRFSERPERNSPPFRHEKDSGEVYSGFIAF